MQPISLNQLPARFSGLPTASVPSARNGRFAPSSGMRFGHRMDEIEALLHAKASLQHINTCLDKMTGLDKEQAAKLMAQAVMYQRLDVVQALKSRGVDLNGPVDVYPMLMGKNYPSFAVMAIDLGCDLKLIQEVTPDPNGRGVKMNGKVVYTDSPLVASAEKSRVDVMEWVLSQHVDPNLCVNKDHKTPLQITAKQSNTRMARLLLSHNAQADLIGEEVVFGKDFLKGMYPQPTPLVDAVDHGNLELADLLLQHHAKANYQFHQGFDSEGEGLLRTILSLAEEKGHTRIAALLKQYGA